MFVIDITQRLSVYMTLHAKMSMDTYMFPTQLVDMTYWPYYSTDDTRPEIKNFFIPIYTIVYM